MSSSLNSTNTIHNEVSIVRGPTILDLNCDRQDLPFTLSYSYTRRMYIETVQAAVWIGSVAAEKKTIYVRQAAQIAQMWLAVAVSH